MTEPNVVERTPSAAPEHPPFRMRGRRRRVLPDLTLPTLEELRWAARQRRSQREPVIAQPRPAVHVEPPVGQDAAVSVPAEALPVAILPVEAPPARPAAQPPVAVLPVATRVAEPAPSEMPAATPVPIVIELPEAAAPEAAAPERAADVEPAPVAVPLYWRLLRLRHTRPNGWLRALFFEGAVATAVVLVLAEAASVWTIVVLPFVVAVVVKANDVLAGSLQRSDSAPREP